LTLPAVADAFANMIKAHLDDADTANCDTKFRRLPSEHPSIESSRYSALSLIMGPLFIALKLLDYEY
jgi:hypothetical protein